MQKVFVQRIIRTTHSEFQGGDLNADSGHFYQEGEKKKNGGVTMTTPLGQDKFKIFDLSVKMAITDCLPN